MKTNTSALMLTAVVVLAVVAMPSTAWAGEWTADNATGKTFLVDKTTNPVFRASNGDIILCTSMTGSGKYTSNTTGEISLDLTGCSENTFGSSCQSGATSGTWALNNKVFHNVIIGNAGDNLTPIGILITGGGTEFGTVKCAGGLMTESITGNMIGEIESPKCGTAGTEYSLNFATASANSSIQKYKQVTTTGTMYNPFADISNTAYEASFESKSKLTLSGAVTPTCS